MEKIRERMRHLTVEFSEMVCATLNEMINLNYAKNESSFSNVPFHKAQGTIAFIHFGGTIQGDCFLLFSKQTTKELVSCLRQIGMYPEDETEKVIIKELVSEVLNTSVGRLLPQLEDEIESVSYMPPIIVSGEITFPRVASNSIVISGRAGNVTCVFALNMVNLKITQTLKTISEDLAAKTRQAHTDGLTGLFNRLHFDEVFKILAEGAHGSEIQLSLMILDVDNLKLINDTFGHQVGDSVIITTAETVMTSLRSEDIPCRYGGDEIVILLPNTPLNNTGIVAGRIMQHLTRKSADLQDRIKNLQDVTLSIGVAQLGEDESPEHLFDRADRALYAAKKAGRNTVKYALPGGVIGDV